MKINKKTRIIIAIIAGILLAIALIMNVVKKPKDNDSSSTLNPIETVSTTVSNGYDVSGKWYGDHNKEIVYDLELKKDGTFKSTWLDNGTYEIVDDNILLKDMAGTIKTFELITNNKEKKEYVLFFDNMISPYTYYRSKEEVVIAEEEQERIEEEMIEIYNAALTQILTTGEWIDNSEDTTLSFTQNQYTVINKSEITGKTETVTHKYKVEDLKVENDVYNVKWKQTDEKGNDFNITDIVVTVDDNNYTFYSSSIPFARSFKKQVDIDFTQPCEGNITGVNSVINKDDLALAEAEASTNNSNPTSPTISTSTRKEYIDETDPVEFNKLVIKEIVGNWKGTFEDIPNKNTIYYTYEFTEDNKYKYNNKEKEETGNYSIVSNGNEKYHSILKFETKGNIYEKKFYFTGNEELGLQFEKNLDPKYFKNK